MRICFVFPTSKCDCTNVKMGSYDNTILLGYYPIMREYRDNRVKAGLLNNGITIDRCIVDEVICLWETGIRTDGSCCGHNIQDGYIGIFEEDIEKVKTLGYKVFDK